MTYTLEQLLAMVIVVSFLGFCLENVWILFRHGFIDNRNMRLPFLTGYGLTVLGFYELADIPTEENQREYFAFAFLIVSAGEIAMGKVTEWAMHIYYWDYSSIPLHITRYFPRYKMRKSATDISLLKDLKRVAERHLAKVLLGNA